MDEFKDLLCNESFEGIVVILDSKSNIIQTNKNFLNLLGFTFSEIKDKNIVDLIVPDEKSLFFDLVFNQDVSNTLTIKFYHKSGAFRFFSFSILNFHKQKILIGNTLKKDFLARKYDYLRESNTNINNIFKNIDVDDIKNLLNFENNPLSILLDLMPIEVWVKDKIGKYIYINDTYTHATGITYEQCLLKDDYQLFSNDTAKSFVDTDELAKKTGKRISFSFETNDDSMASFAEVTKIPVYNKSNIYIGIFGFSVNTSHSKISEIKLEEEKNKLIYILENIDGYIFELNTNSEFIFISDKLRNLIGIDVNDKELMMDFHKKYRTTELNEKIKLAQNGKKVSVKNRINGKLLSFDLTPVKNNTDTYNIVGFGKEIE